MKKKLFTALALILIFTLALAGCGKDNKKADKKSKAEVAIENIKKIDTKDYFAEDMSEVKSLVDNAIDKLKKNDDKGVKAVLKDFNDKLSKIPKKSASIKAFQDKLNNEISSLGDDKAKAEEVVKSYLEKIKNIKSRAELDKMSSEITGKIEEVTGKEIADIKASEVTETAVKEAPKEHVTASSQGNSGSSNSSSGSKSSNSGNKPNKTNNSGSGSVNKPSEKSKPSKPSKPSTPSKPSKRWVVDKAAWTETINHPATYKTVTKYRPTWWIKVNGNITIYYSEAEQEAKLDELDNKGIPSSWGNGEDEAYTETVLDMEAWTETINHPEEGHWE